MAACFSAAVMLILSLHERYILATVSTLFSSGGWLMVHEFWSRYWDVHTHISPFSSRLDHTS